MTSNSATSAGAIDNSLGNLTVTNCTFKSNTASNGYGGAIYNDNVNDALNINDSYINVTNSTFSNNNATKDGGAIKNAQGVLNVAKCNFNSNLADNGGAVNGYRGNTIISDCTFTSNKATSYGGAIYSYGLFTINGSTLPVIQHLPAEQY